MNVRSHRQTTNTSLTCMIAHVRSLAKVVFLQLLYYTYINLSYIQGEAHKVLQNNSTQTIDHIQKCLRQKFQFSRRPSYWTTLFFIGGDAETTTRSTPLFQMEPCIFFR